LIIFQPRAQATLCLCFVLGFEALRFVNGRLLDGMAEVPTKVFVATIESPHRPRNARIARAKPRTVQSGTTC